jgi:hypothetical protein
VVPRSEVAYALAPALAPVLFFGGDLGYYPMALRYLFQQLTEQMQSCSPQSVAAVIISRA